VHLRAVKLRGFKSFPDTVEVRLEPGVGVIVGPNGSGKSNVADAIRWAAGSLSPSELRAEKPDDVLFAGAANRNAADFCEVELLFDNEAGDGPVEYSELSIARRLHRGGEGQYLLNRTPVRLTRYWPSPPRCRRREIESSENSTGPSPSELSNKSSTSQ
jgi:chromosome segregation protein